MYIVVKSNEEVKFTSSMISERNVAYWPASRGERVARAWRHRDAACTARGSRRLPPSSPSGTCRGKQHVSHKYCLLSGRKLFCVQPFLTTERFFLKKRWKPPLPLLCPSLWAQDPCKGLIRRLFSLLHLLVSLHSFEWAGRSHNYLIKIIKTFHTVHRFRTLEHFWLTRRLIVLNNYCNHLRKFTMISVNKPEFNLA